MGKLLASEFVSLDGVFESPSWTIEFGFDPAMGAAMSELMGPGTSDILLGRVTHGQFAPAWSSRTADEDPGAPFMNGTPKHVVTSGSPDVEWANSSTFGRYDASRVAELKSGATGNVWTTGSGTLVRALLADRLIHELPLFVYPVVRAGGARLFADSGEPRTLALAGVERYDNGVLHLTYTPAG